MKPPVDLQHQFYDLLMESQWWPPERLGEFARTQLAALLRHARAQVPFYEHRLDAVLQPNGDIDWGRWAEIPVVKRRDMIDHRDAMLARKLPPGAGAVADFQTSGSTSLPITITTNARVGLAANAARWRAQQWNHIGWSRNLVIRLGSTTAPLDEPYGEKKGSWGPPWAKDRGEVWEINVKLPPAKALEFMRSHDITYFNTGAAPAHVFALEAERLGAERPRLDAIMAQGASVGYADRVAVARVFGARFMESYGSKEGGQMAHPCERGRLHINSEVCLVEICDDAGQPVPVGTLGHVIVTPFYSTAQPLIRYDQGDIARMGGLCACGRCSPTLMGIEGRNSIFFTHPDGRRATSLMPEEGRAALGCTFWQIAQTGPLEFEVRYVPNDWNFSSDEDEFTRLFRAQYFDDANVRFRRIGEIPLSKTGKFVEYKVEMARPS